MNMNQDDVRASARTVSDAGAAVERVAGATSASHSTIGRVGMAISAIKLGARLLPAGVRLIKRYPVASAVAIAGLVWVLYSRRAAGRSADW
jgi:hypothetical protein